MKTRGDMLRFAIAFALMRACKLVRGLRQGLGEEERYQSPTTWFKNATTRSAAAWPLAAWAEQRAMPVADVPR